MAHALVRVHGDSEEKVAVAEFFIGEAGFFGAEEDGYLACAGGGVDAGGGFGEGEEGMLKVSFTYGGGADDEGAVGDGLGEG